MRSDVDILPIVVAQQGDHLAIEAPATPLRVRCDFLAEPGRKADGAGDQGVLRMGNG